jgi:hypothetical protein
MNFFPKKYTPPPKITLRLNNEGQITLLIIVRVLSLVASYDASKTVNASVHNNGHTHGSAKVRAGIISSKINMITAKSSFIKLLNMFTSKLTTRQCCIKFSGNILHQWESKVYSIRRHDGIDGGRGIALILNLLKPSGNFTYHQV